MALIFANISELRAYVDQFIIENGENEITGEQHNNVENGLIDFIISSPENYNKATVVASTGNYVATAAQCTLIFKPTATGSITLTDNKWNKWTIVNMAASAKALVGSIGSYKSVGNLTVNYVAAGSALTIIKGSDNVWYQASPVAGSAPSGSLSFGEPLNVYVGSVDYPEPFTVFEITVSSPKEHSLSVFLDGIYIPNDVEGQISYTPSYGEDGITVTFNQETKIGQLYTFRYAYQV